MSRVTALRAALPLLVLSALAAGCGGSSSGVDDPTLAASNPPSTTPASTPAASGPCAPATPTAHDQNLGHEPPLTIKPGTYTATIVTNCGTIVAALNATKAPHTVNSFAFLAAKHYFDGSPCHRLTTQGIFVLQCGAPTGSGRGGPGYTIPDENLTGATYPAGTLAMANTGAPHTGGSQFFFCYADTPLPPQYTPFGKVTTGLAVLTAIAKNGEDDSNGPGDGHPKSAVVIKTFTVALAAK
jgi:peptidyl-prolyl cis-trans isomerase B (cyclophilin B)